MNFTTFCDNKGCRKEMSPVVDKNTLEAYCTECDQKINCLTIFMRRQMAAEGMVKKNLKRKMAWSVKCDKCHKEGPPNISDSKLMCFSCNKELDKLSKPFAETLKQNIKRL